MSDKENPFEILESYVAFLNNVDAYHFPEHIRFSREIGEDKDPYNQLIIGLTTLCRACIDLKALFNAASTAKHGKVELENFIIGLLFEIRDSIDDWIAARIRLFYEKAKKDSNIILRVGSDMYKYFEPHRQAMGIIRNHVFHKELWHNEEAVLSVARLIYNKGIPGQLHKVLVDYGVNTNKVLKDDGIGIPGIGCFGVIPISGAKDMVIDFKHAYWPKV